MGDGSHHHGSGGRGISGFEDNVASGIGIAVGVIGGSILLMYALHILVIVAAVIGFTVMGAGTGYATIRIRGAKRKKASQALAPQVYPQVYPHSGYPQIPAQDPNGTVHVHFHGMSESEVSEIIRRQPRQ